MTRPVDLFARRMAKDAWFLASALELYAQSEGLTDEQLAAMLGCSVTDLTALRLCRRPLSEPAEAFRRDIDALARAYGVHADVIADVARRADAVDSLRRSQSSATGRPDMLMAARDREREDHKVSDQERTTREPSREDKGDDTQ